MSNHAAIMKSITETFSHIALVESPLMPANSLLLMGSSIHTDNIGMIGIIDMTGEFDSWVFNDAVITSIWGSRQALDKLKEAIK